jgi:hypothetical protein
VRWKSVTALVLVGVLSMTFSVVTAGSSSPKPATLVQVEALVKDSANINTLTSTVERKVVAAPNDFSWSNYPEITNTLSSCATLTACVYGDASSSKTIVLFGDSHALMWLPAIAPVAVAKNYKVIVIWVGNCPPADLSVYFPQYGFPLGCNEWRAKMIGLIQSIHPQLVILGEHTTDLPSSATTDFTNAQLKSGLIKTINQLKSSKTKVAVLEDTVQFDVAVPKCLSRFATSVKSCGVAFPNPKFPGLQTGEEEAAAATKSLLVKTQDWLCTKTCSAVIGNYIPYIDLGHVSFSYAAYLSGVMGQALKPDF